MLSNRYLVKLGAKYIPIALLLVCGVARAGLVTYKYDSLGRLSQATFSTGATVNYTYDANGNRQIDSTSGVKLSAPVTAAIIAIITELLIE